jgi:hypothetical protein
MKGIRFSALFLALFVSTLDAQTFGWKTNYPPAPNPATGQSGTSKPINLIPSPDGGAVLFSEISGNPYRYRFQRLNAVGQVLEENYFQNTSTDYDLRFFEPLADGGFIATGEKPNYQQYIVRFDSHGDTVFTRKKVGALSLSYHYTTRQYHPLGIQEAPDGRLLEGLEYYCWGCGYIDKGNFFTLDAQGNPSPAGWDSEEDPFGFGFSASGELWTVYRGVLSYYFVVKKWDAASSAFRPVNDSINIGNTISPLTKLNGMLMTPDSGALILCFVPSQPGGPSNPLTLLKLGENGQVEWTKIHGTADEVLRFKTGKNFPGGGYLLTGQRGSQPNAVVRLDPAGEIVWERAFAQEDIGGAAPSADGGVFVWGQNTASAQAFVLKLDADGNPSQTEQTIVSPAQNGAYEPDLGITYSWNYPGQIAGLVQRVGVVSEFGKELTATNYGATATQVEFRLDLSPALELLKGVAFSPDETDTLFFDLPTRSVTIENFPSGKIYRFGFLLRGVFADTTALACFQISNADQPEFDSTPNNCNGFRLEDDEMPIAFRVENQASVAAEEAAAGPTARLSILPNPVGDRALLSLTPAPSEASNILLFNHLGQLCKTIVWGNPESGSLQIGLQELPPGLYTIRLEHKSSNAVARFLKM